MFQSIAVSGFRCLQDVSVSLSPLNILVGANASGKSTFLDVFAFVSSVVRNGVQAAFEERTSTPVDLVTGRRSGEISIQFAIAPPIELNTAPPAIVKYVLTLKVESDTSSPFIKEEELYLGYSTDQLGMSAAHFQEIPQVVLERLGNGEDEFISERTDDVYRFRIGGGQSLLGNLPADQTRFPVSTWLKGLLSKGIHTLALDSRKLRQASPPSAATTDRVDGSNLPWMVQTLQREDPPAFQQWKRHIAITLPGLQDIEVVIREDDRHAYLMIKYEDGLRIPSWLVSDGTLRLLALTILAYLPNKDKLFLIEEPENGIHPTAVESVYQSLSSVYDGQIFVASHSPVLLSAASPEQLLCFSRDAAGGAVSVIRGDQHPKLRDWKREVPLGVMVASGILD